MFFEGLNNFIATIFKWPMIWFYSWTGSYLVSLLLYALLVKILFLPFSIQQQKNQIKGAKLRPKIALIEKKYAGATGRDAQMAKQQEIQDLQQREGYSALSGCLPLILQMIIIVGLYQVIRRPLSYLVNLGDDVIQGLADLVNGALGTTYGVANDQISIISAIRQNGLDVSAIADASLFPDLTLFGGAINLGDFPNIGNFNWLLLIPVLTYALAFLQMKVTRWFNTPVMSVDQTAQMQASNKMMDITMPLMGLFIAFITPAAVGVYWLLGYVFGILQTIILSKLMPLPTFTDEEIRQYEKELKAAARPNYGRANVNYTAENGGRVYGNGVRSLHHIDDDDDDVPGKKTGPKPTAAMSKQEKAERELQRQEDKKKHDEERRAAYEERMAQKQAARDAAAMPTANGPIDQPAEAEDTTDTTTDETV